MAIELVLGLGNPGDRYAHTRHNVGFDVVDRVLARRSRAASWSTRDHAELAVVTPGRWVVLARPLLYMNRSGQAAERLLAEFDLVPSEVLVVVDDIDLPLGALRLRSEGGPGTHNGLRDICRALGNGYARLRVGIRGGAIRGELAEYVVEGFADDERERASAAIDRAADAVEAVLRTGVVPAMNVFNRRP
jgi:PTH1 family peptidyl-tRNA hydrolase